MCSVCCVHRCHDSLDSDGRQESGHCRGRTQSLARQPDTQSLACDALNWLILMETGARTLNEAGDWLVSSLHDSAAPRRVICFPYAGGGSAVFKDWQAALGAGVEVLAVAPPGRDHRHRAPAVATMDELMAALVPHLMSLRPKPTVYFGHSLGGLVAYEAARRVLSLGDHSVNKLVVSATQIPGAPSIMRGSIADMTDDHFLSEIIALGGTPEEVVDEPELLRFFLPQLRADFELYERYRPAHVAPLRIPIVGLAGTDDQLARPEQVAQWANLTVTAFRNGVIPGGHFFLHSSPAAVLDFLAP